MIRALLINNKLIVGSAINHNGWLKWAISILFAKKDELRAKK